MSVVERSSGWAVSGRDYAPDVALSEARTHEWGYDGYCRHCGADRFTRDGLRDGQSCVRASRTTEGR